MTTLLHVVDQVRRRLSPDALTSVTALSADMASDDLLLSVDDASGISDGSVIEIDSELMRVQSADQDANTVTLYPFGRGYNSTTAADHTQGSMVVLDPDYPFSAVVDMMNSVVGELFSMGLTAIGSYEAQFSMNAPFTLPAEVITPLGVHLLNETTGEWYQTYSWRYDPYAANQLWIANVDDGRTVKVTYTREPLPLDADQPTSDFYTLTGYDQRLADVVALGVAYRIVTLRSAARLNRMTAAANSDAQAKPISEGRLIGQVLYGEYVQRVQAELAAQRRQYPASAHRTF